MALYFSVCMLLNCSNRPHKYRSSWPIASSSSVADALGILLVSSSAYLLRAHLPDCKCQHPCFFVREPTLPSAWQTRSSGALTPPGNRLQPMTDGSWHGNAQFPSPWVGLFMGECVLNWFPELPQWGCAPFASSHGQPDHTPC